MSVQLIDWDLALIQKYNYSGPRYTSYPTALEFSPEFGPAEFDAAVARYPQRPSRCTCISRFAINSAISAAATKSSPVSSIRPTSIWMCLSRRLFIARRFCWPQS